MIGIIIEYIAALFSILVFIDPLAELKNQLTLVRWWFCRKNGYLEISNSTIFFLQSIVISMAGID
ncbi:MAG: hypothetical protein IPP53_09045 [Bacteroidetes bacterium]|nr:hypothetical protein [Bacteroidota bacterium]